MAPKARGLFSRSGTALGQSRPVRRGQKLAVHGGSVLIGMVAYSIGINYLRYGPAGVKAYAKAKLMNQVTQAGPGGVPSVASVGPADYLFRRARNAIQTGPTDAPPPTLAAGRNFA